MAICETFNPAWGSNQTIATAASAATLIGKGSKSVLLTNSGSEIVYVKMGGSGDTATIADYPVLPLSQVSVSKFQDFAYVITYSAAPGQLQVMNGEGF